MWSNSASRSVTGRVWRPPTSRTRRKPARTPPGAPDCGPVPRTPPVRRPREASRQQCPEGLRDLRGVVLEHPAPPRPQHQPRVAVQRRRLQDALRAPGQCCRDLGGALRFLAADGARVRRRGGEEARPEGGVQQFAPVVAEDGHPGRVNHPVGVEGAAARAVDLVVLRGLQQGLVQGRGAAQRLLLGLGPADVAAPGIAGRGEVQDGNRSPVDRRRTVGGEPTGCDRAALSRDLDGRFTAPGGKVLVWNDLVWPIYPGSGPGFRQGGGEETCRPDRVRYPPAATMVAFSRAISRNLLLT